MFSNKFVVTESELIKMFASLAGSRASYLKKKLGLSTKQGGDAHSEIAPLRMTMTLPSSWDSSGTGNPLMWKATPVGAKHATVSNSWASKMK